MKAIVCQRFGPPSNLEYLEMPDPVPAPDELLINIKACSVNFPDTLIIQGQYQYKPDFPFSPGSDIAGIVEVVGEKVTNFKPGDEIVAITTWGGFAEKIVCKAYLCFAKPPNMDMVQAASFLLAYGTSYYALADRGSLKKDETMLVLGASGGVGLAAVELGKLLGARVIAAASSTEKLELCRQYGADVLINYQKENLKERVKELTGNKGVDVIYDPVGGQYSDLAMRSMAWGGRYLVVGFAAGEIPRLPLNLPLLKGCAIIGVFWGAFTQKQPKRNFHQISQLTRWFNAGKLNPHIHATYPLVKAPYALEEIINRKVRGKIVIVMDDQILKGD
jgi:NADPH2:quinone reductase